MLNSLSIISKGVKKWNLYFKRNHGTAKCTVFVERDCLFHSKEFTWLSESFSHTCAHICGLNLLGWVELNLWDTVCRHSPLNSICLDCTPPEAIIHMSLCLCVCFMSGLCRLLGFAAAYLYSVLWNIFQTLWSTQPPHPSAALEFYQENWRVQVEMFRLSLSAIFTSSLCNLLKKCMCLSASWKMMSWLEPECHVQVCLSEVLLSCGIPVKLFLARKFGVSQYN